MNENQPPIRAASTLSQRLELVGRWVGTLHFSGGDRLDFDIELDANGRYKERSRRGVIEGCWTEAEGELRLNPDDCAQRAMAYRILKIERLERAQNFMVLRYAGIASRNLPILVYRVDRASGDTTVPNDA